MSIAELLARDWRMLIGADHVEAANHERFDVFDPGTGQVIASVPRGSSTDIDRAVTEARAAFDDRRWLRIEPRQRERIMWRLADLLEEHAEELALVECANQGMPLSMARGMPARLALSLRYNAGWIERMDGQARELFRNGVVTQAFTRKEPIGVVGLIIPWNGPLGGAVEKITFALAAGCTAVLKPAEETPLTALMFGDLCLEAGVPAGVINIVTGFGEETGAPLALHPDVDKISFTGSTEVGHALVRASGDSNLKKLTLELGGKSPMIVFPDADVEAAIPAAAQAILANSGQICSAASRLLVHRDLFDQVVEGVAKIAAATRLGYYTDAQAELGPLISAKQLARVSGYVDSGFDAGAEAVVGGHALPGDGYFFEPTVMINVEPGMKMVQDEIFGPVVAVLPFADEDEAVRIANDTTYGLAASVFTGDITRALRVANQLRVGRVGINNHPSRELSMPTGGFKQSGWGRECGAEGIDQFLETKSIYL